MQHLNYCRQALDQFVAPTEEYTLCQRDLFRNASREDFLRYCFEVGQQLRVSVKFTLPKNARIIDDEKLRAIDDSMGVSLPFDNIALEYEADVSGPADIKKNILLVTQTPDFIVVLPVLHMEENGLWIFDYPVYFNRENFFSPGRRDQVECKISRLVPPEIKDVAIDTASKVSFIILDFLNALACRNVHIEKSPAKANKQGKKVKTALPFDDYHFLAVDVPGKSGARGEGLGGSHRAPREHLRRGHIRRLDSGPIWVNACVVNAGICSKVGKSYLLRKSPAKQAHA